jgi:three-Cys-motif partner protein
MPVNHEFGGQHTELKLSLVEEYLKLFTKALRNQFEELWYIDAFAGTGTRTVRTIENGGGLFESPIVEQVETRRGSAMIALDVRPSFDRLVFIESNPAYCEELRSLKARNPDRHIAVVQGDANRAIQSQIGWDGWKSARGVLFLDPYGMEVEWATLEAVAATKAIDVWFLFPLAGLFRQATRRLTDIDEHKRAALTRMFGSDRWEEELYPKVAARQHDMFGGSAERERAEDVAGLEQYVKGRLETIFPKVLKPLALPVNIKPQRFSLFLCISNPEPKAIGLATRIGNHILGTGISS